MPLATLPPEVLTIVFDHLDVKDLLCAALVNRNWRTACTARQTLWQRHWKELDLEAVERRYTLAKEDVDWFSQVSSHVCTERAWETANFTTRFLDLPPDFESINSVAEDTILITTTRPKAEGEAGIRWSTIIDVFHLVDNDSFEIRQTFPTIPGEFHSALHIKGLGHVLRTIEYPRTYYYISDNAYECVGHPEKMPGGKIKWPKLPGFVFLGGQEILSEGAVYLHVNDANGSSPKLFIHEQDTDNLNWVRYGPWKGRCEMLDDDMESFCNHILTDECVIIETLQFKFYVYHRTTGEMHILDTTGRAAACFTLMPPKGILEDLDVDAFIIKLQDTPPSPTTVEVGSTGAGSVRQLVVLKDDDYFFKQFSPVGKHLFCAVDSGLFVYRDYANPLFRRTTLAPVVINFGCSDITFATSDNRVIVSALSTLYVIDARQFDADSVPQALTALQIERWGIVPPKRYGKKPERGASAQLVVTPRAIYEHLKVYPKLWDEEKTDKEKTEKEKAHKEKTHKEKAEHAVKHLMRVYEFA